MILLFSCELKEMGIDFEIQLKNIFNKFYN